MDKSVAALVLDEIGTLLELQGENQFRARAFYNAARALDSLDGELAALLASGELEQVPGLGPATLRAIHELVTTGGSSLHDELRARTPSGLLDLLRLPGLGARRVHLLHQQLGITTLDELERAANEDRIAALPGFGKRTQERVLAGLDYVRSQMGRRRQPEAWAMALWLAAFVEAQSQVLRVEVAGELRRRMETVQVVELVAAVAERADPVLELFATLPGTAAGERVGESTARVQLADGVQGRLTCVPPDAFAAALLLRTGSVRHVELLTERASGRGLRLDGSGLWRNGERVPVAEETDLYGALGLPFIEPELREGGHELELAEAGRLPRLIQVADLRGCFHCHTTYSDGKASLAEMAEAARERGWRYLGLADHSQAAGYANGLSPDRIRQQHNEIDAWNARHGHELWLFKGIEADILPDGRLDYADEAEDVLARFDYVIGSVHSNFGMSGPEITARVLRALENPHLTFLGHPTGRLLLSREGYKLDVEAVVAEAARRGVGIEINANPRRLELDWAFWHDARERGVKAAINPDAHSTIELENVEYGVGVARKGWLAVDDVVNAWDLEDVKHYLQTQRSR